MYLGLAFGLGRKPLPPYTAANAEATALFARMDVQPTEARKELIDRLITAEKASGGWDNDDGYYILAAHDAQAARLNWKQDAFNLTAVDAPTFLANRGFTGNGTSSYHTTDFNPTTAVGANYLQNDAHMAVWCGTNVNSTGIDIGATNSRIISRNATAASLRVNSGTTNTPTLPVSTSIGWFCWSRAAAGTYRWVKDASAPAEIVQNSGALLDIPFFVGALAGAGPVASNFSTRRIQAASFGGALSDAQMAARRAALLAYMTHVGAA